MKKTLFLLLIFCCLVSCSKKSEPKSYVNMFPEYRPAKYSVEDLPRLIRKISDDRKTKTIVPMFGGFYANGDIAFLGIMDIIPELPFREFIPEPYFSQWDDIGFTIYYNYVRKDKAHRIALQSAVLNWVNAASSKQKKTWGKIKQFPVEGH